MVIIGNFSSVFEIAFAINALFYIFEAAPFAENRIEKKLKQYYKLRDKKIELTKNHYAFPIGFVLSATYPFTKQVLGKCSIIMSLVAVALLIYSGFSPNAEMAAWGMIITLIALLLIVPLGAFITYRGCTRLIDAATKELEKEIEKARESNINE